MRIPQGSRKTRGVLISLGCWSVIPCKGHWSKLPPSDVGFVLPMSFGYDQRCFTSCGTDGNHAPMSEACPSQDLASQVWRSIPRGTHSSRTSGPGHHPNVPSAPAGEVSSWVPVVASLDLGASWPLRIILLCHC